MFETMKNICRGKIKARRLNIYRTTFFYLLNIENYALTKFFICLCIRYLCWRYIKVYHKGLYVDLRSLMFFVNYMFPFVNNKKCWRKKTYSFIILRFFGYIHYIQGRREFITYHGSHPIQCKKGQQIFRL